MAARKRKTAKKTAKRTAKKTHRKTSAKGLTRQKASNINNLIKSARFTLNEADSCVYFGAESKDLKKQKQNLKMLAIQSNWLVV